MSIFYRSKRIGKNGKPFFLYKFRTLNENNQGQFAQEATYTRFGKFLRKTHLDELPQILNVIKRDMNFVGPRPDEERNINVIPEEYRKVILSVKPGIVDLASIHFYDEEKLLNKLHDPYLYWQGIKPIKILLQIFYIQNKCFLLNVAVLWIALKKIISSFFK